MTPALGGALRNRKPHHHKSVIWETSCQGRCPLQPPEGTERGASLGRGLGRSGRRGCLYPQSGHNRGSQQSCFLGPLPVES